MRRSRPPQAVVEVARGLGADLGSLRPLSDGTSNRVWGLERPFLVLAMAGPQHDAAGLRRRVALAARLPGTFVQPAGDVVRTSTGALVTVWERVPVEKRAWDWAEVGAAVARLHATTLGGERDLPDAQNLDAVAERVRALAAAGTLSRHAALLLVRAAARLVAEAAGLDGRRVLVHGDLHPANILRVRRGVLLCDIDELARAHPWWDLAFLLDPGRPPGIDQRGQAALREGYGRPLPEPGVVRTLSREAHLRRTVRQLEIREPGPAAWYYDRVRVGAWAALEADWLRTLHPVVSRPRHVQAELLFRGEWAMRGEPARFAARPKHGPRAKHGAADLRASADTRRPPPPP